MYIMYILEDSRYCNFETCCFICYVKSAFYTFVCVHDECRANTEYNNANDFWHVHHDVYTIAHHKHHAYADKYASFN